MAQIYAVFIASENFIPLSEQYTKDPPNYSVHVCSVSYRREVNAENTNTNTKDPQNYSVHICPVSYKQKRSQCWKFVVFWSALLYIYNSTNKDLKNGFEWKKSL